MLIYLVTLTRHDIMAWCMYTYNKTIDTFGSWVSLITLLTPLASHSRVPNITRRARRARRGFFKAFTQTMVTWSNDKSITNTARLAKTDKYQTPSMSPEKIKEFLFLLSKKIPTMPCTTWHDLGHANNPSSVLKTLFPLILPFGPFFPAFPGRPRGPAAPLKKSSTELRHNNSL